MTVFGLPIKNLSVAQGLLIVLQGGQYLPYIMPVVPRPVNEKIQIVREAMVKIMSAKRGATCEIKGCV